MDAPWARREANRLRRRATRTPDPWDDISVGTLCVPPPRAVLAGTSMNPSVDFALFVVGGEVTNIDALRWLKQRGGKVLAKKRCSLWETTIGRIELT